MTMNMVLCMFVWLGFCTYCTSSKEPRFIFLSSAPALESYNVDKSQVSVSGISSGACFATQFHVIHSAQIMGAGIIAGAPFACSGGSAVTAVACMQTPSLISPTALEAIVTSGAAVGNADATSNLRHDRVYIFDGQHDSVVNPAIGPKTRQFYDHFISDAGHIKTVFDVQAEHGQPTDNFGGPCNKLSQTDYMLNCNYSAAFDLLNFIHGGHLKRPNVDTSAAGKLLKFNQEDFFYVSTPSMYSMDDIGYIYVPSHCLDKSRSCKLHIAFHGCLMGQRYIGENYVSHAGYNEVGELNNIIILYPQVIKSLTNPQGCWDWWGYTGTLFATKSGFQITAVERMLNKILGL